MLLPSVTAYMQAHQMVSPGDRIVVGVSGGADSMVLLHILCQCRDSLGLELVVAHLNHDLRPEADQEEEMVQQVCRSWDVPFFAQKVDVAGEAARSHKSLEEAGRDCRYQFFHQLAERQQARRIAVAHHRNDQAETVLLHLLRGSGIRGLQGMLPVKGKIIRPLLGTTRQEIEVYARENGLVYCSDQSNNDPAFIRNRIRLELIPFLQDKFNPGIVDGLARLAGIAREENEALEYYTEQLWPQLAAPSPDGWLINGGQLSCQPQAVRNRLIFKALQETSGSSEWSRDDMARVHSLLGRSGSNLVLHMGHNVRVGLIYTDLLFARDLQESQPFCYPVSVPGKTAVTETGMTYEFIVSARADFQPAADTICLDMDKITLPLWIRSRREGDRFEPVGMTGSKTIKKYLIDKKIPARERNQVALLTSGQQIYAVLGHRIAKAAAVDENTERILVIKGCLDAKTREADPSGDRNCPHCKG